MKLLFCAKILKTLSLFVTITFLISSCKHKTNFNELSEVSYSKDIAPIISSNCSASGCHGTIEYEKLSLVTYEDLMKGGVSAGSPEKSKLYRTLTSYGDDIMPKKPFNELTERQIQLIYVWIGQGAKNN